MQPGVNGQIGRSITTEYQHTWSSEAVDQSPPVQLFCGGMAVLTCISYFLWVLIRVSRHCVRSPEPLVGTATVEEGSLISRSQRGSTG